MLLNILSPFIFCSLRCCDFKLHSLLRKHMNSCANCRCYPPPLPFVSRAWCLLFNSASSVLVCWHIFVRWMDSVMCRVFNVLWERLQCEVTHRAYSSLLYAVRNILLDLSIFVTFHWHQRADESLVDPPSKVDPGAFSGQRQGWKTPRGPSGGALLRCIAGVHYWEISLG